MSKSTDVISRTIQRKIREVAREYRAKGFDVATQPSASQLPPALAGFRPDLLVVSETEHVVVEVQTASLARKGNALQELATAIQGLEGWRLELVLTKPRPEAVQVQTELLRKHIEAASAVADVDIGAGWVHLWVAVELTLLDLLDRPQSATRSPGHLVKEAFSLGILSVEQYHLFMSAGQLRNQLAHSIGEGLAPTVKDFERFRSATSGLVSVLEDLD